MTFSLKSIRDRYEVKASTYGMIVDSKGQHSIVLTDCLGNVVLKTESFPRQERLLAILQSLKNMIANPLSYFTQTSEDGSCYFSIKDKEGRYLAFSDCFASSSIASTAQEEIMKIGQVAPVTYFHKLAPPTDDPLPKRRKILPRRVK